MAGGCGKELELISHHWPEEFRKGQKVMPPPRILSGIYLGWSRCALPGRALSQNDWPKTTLNLIPSPKIRGCEPHGRAVLLVPWVTLSKKLSCFVSMCVSLDNSFLNVRQEPTLRPWKGSPFLQQMSGRHVVLTCSDEYGNHWSDFWAPRVTQIWNEMGWISKT